MVATEPIHARGRAYPAPALRGTPSPLRVSHLARPGPALTLTPLRVSVSAGRDLALAGEAEGRQQGAEGVVDGVVAEVEERHEPGAAQAHNDIMI